jgi:hypothetical protein
MLEDFNLLLFSPALVDDDSMIAKFRFGAELAHEDRILREDPLNLVGVFGREFRRKAWRDTVDDARCAE